LMKMVNIFKQLLKPKLRPNNFKKCSMLEPPLLNKKFKWMLKNLQTNQLTLNLLSKKRMMVILKLSRK